MNHAARKAGLETRLLGFGHLWRPQPFKFETPAWCTDHPALAADLLALDDDAVEHLSGDNAALIALAARHLPELAALAALIDLPTRPSPAQGPAGWPTEPRLFVDVPGRKQAQIEAFATALGEPGAPVLEWCSGKGHLGRLLSRRWQLPVTSLEIDRALCDAGEALAARLGDGLGQRFVRADALADASTRHLAGRHGVALHACGDLHTRLVAGAVAQASPAVDVVPCCYYRMADETYRPFIPTPLRLSRDDLRLAVTETVTAAPRQRRQSRRALAWKLGWVELRRQLTGMTEYRSFPPVPEAWLRGSFAEFARHMAARERLLVGETGSAEFEARGFARAARMLRLQLARLAFRRPLEVWLLMDMAAFLEQQGYAVGVAPFCTPTLTPRNLMLSARKP